ncbi:MAG: decaprenyl-phosphate phosphoribosyltransferase [Anaerolineae bacterium]|nr:decaprenyl-phosphate phosphoribosyltransferase [Candidatus Roseilinea sp.]MDW8451782.1 decaprenyl-phosphate phosphoribosyltransferase [Anaerolineae bacterium]
MESKEAVAAPPQASRVALGLLRSMRPKQWTKNIFIFAALVFDGKLFQPGPLINTLIGFVVLCLLSSAVYLINDCADVNADRAHPVKRNRPIARGDVPIPLAVAWAVVLIVGSLAVAFALNLAFGAIALAYLATATLYTFKVKHVVILDVIFLAAGFVLRVAAGTPLVDAERFSPWLYTCMGLLALLIGFGKRRAELVELDGRSTTRAALDHYSVPLLDQIIAIVTGALIVSYTLYTFFAPQLPTNHAMMLTIPFVVYALFRYLYLVHVKGEGGAPDELALKDRPLQVTFALWALVAIAVLYIRLPS